LALAPAQIAAADDAAGLAKPNTIKQPACFIVDLDLDQSVPTIAAC
jgi:hypothetical protein